MFLEVQIVLEFQDNFVRSYEFNDSVGQHIIFTTILILALMVIPHFRAAFD